MRAPQVGGDGLAQRGVVGHRFRRIEALPRFQCVLAQHAGAEPVDGEDRGQVDGVGGQAQPEAKRIGALDAAREVVVQHGVGQLCLRRCVFAWRVRAHQISGQQQARADAAAQFLGRGLGESDCQYLANGQATLHHQPHHQGGQGEGLAGAGGGLDRAHAMQRQDQVGIVDRGVHSACSRSRSAAS